MEARKANDHLDFVIEKHFDGQLHYDLQLQINNRSHRFKNWSIPKGPSLNPNYKRLAVEMDPPAKSDHPVTIWDRGTWIPKGNVRESLKKGQLDFELQGEKLKGRWTLVHSDTLSAGAKSWLLMKRADENASMRGSVTVLRPESVALGKTLSKPLPRPSAKLAPPPRFITPQLAIPTIEVPEGEGWLYEIKQQGPRVQCRIHHGHIRWFDDGGADISHRYQDLSRELEILPLKNAIFDGQIEEPAQGETPFSHTYTIFDLLYVDGQSLLRIPLRERKKRLEHLLASQPLDKISYSSHAEQAGLELFRQSCRMELAGIVSKRGDQPHRPGASDQWQFTDCPISDNSQMSLLSQS